MAVAFVVRLFSVQTGYAIVAGNMQKDIGLSVTRIATIAATCRKTRSNRHWGIWTGVPCSTTRASPVWSCWWSARGSAIVPWWSDKIRARKREDDVSG